jgi:hypothetical protein
MRTTPSGASATRDESDCALRALKALKAQMALRIRMAITAG